MKKFFANEKLSDNFCRYIVNCIDVALTEDHKRYVLEFDPDTTNGVPHCIHDWINSNMVKYLAPEYRIFKFNRYSWKSNMVVDDKNKIAYTIMRQKGLKRVKAKKRTSPHYLQTFVTILNAEFQADNKQIMMEELYTELFSQETFQNDFINLCGENLKSTQGYKHCLIAFDTHGGQLSDVKAWILDKDLEIFDEMCLNEFIKPDYSKLTKSNNHESDKLPEDTSSDRGHKKLLKLKETSKEL